MKRDCEKCMYHVECPLTDYFCICTSWYFKEKPNNPCCKYKNYKLNRLSEILMFVSVIVMCAGAVVSIIILIMIISQVFFGVVGA